MYILGHDQSLRSSPQPMAMDHNTPSSPQMSTKKRKRGGPDSSTIADSLAALSSYYSNTPFTMTPAPSSPSTFTEAQQFENMIPTTPHHRSSKHDPHTSKRVHLSPKSRRPPTPASQLSHEYFSRPQKSSTSACHICHRRPTTTSDLSGYTDCEVCHERTCYVCVRRCEGHCGNESGEGRKVCGKCCLEVGSDGMVWCTTCYEDDRAEEEYKIGPTKKELQNDSSGRINAWLNGVGSGLEA